MHCAGVVAYSTGWPLGLGGNIRGSLQWPWGWECAREAFVVFFIVGVGANRNLGELVDDGSEGLGNTGPLGLCFTLGQWLFTFLHSRHPSSGHPFRTHLVRLMAPLGKCQIFIFTCLLTTEK